MPGIPPINKDEAILEVRKIVCEELTDEQDTLVSLCSLLWDKANECFPGGPGAGWDYAGFKLDVNELTIQVDLSTYPNAFGASYSDIKIITADKFNAIVRRYGLPEHFRAIETKTDLQTIVNDEVKVLVAQAEKANNIKQEKELVHKRLDSAIVLNESDLNSAPKMNFNCILIKLVQAYCKRTVSLNRAEGAYELTCIRTSPLSRSTDSHKLQLTQPQAVWAERRIQATLDSKDNSTWHSLPGGDKMSVSVKKDGDKDFELYNCEPYNKFTDLMREFEYLAEYGSLTEAEKAELTASVGNND